MERKTAKTGIAELSPFAGRTTVHVIVETPRGHRNKYHYDADLDAFRLKKVLAAGFAFPYDFGFIPGTKASDGDPLDVLLLMDEPAYPGCIVEARLVGVLEAGTEGRRANQSATTGWSPSPRTRWSTRESSRCKT